MPAAQRIGKYEVVAHLAAGGMGQVYLGKVVGPGGFERHCVVKTLDATSIEGDDAVAMFLDEARLVGSLHHQHIGQVVEVDRDADGRYFLVMEYVHGETAEHVLDAAAKADHILPLGFGLSVVSALAAALHYAHARCTVASRGRRGVPSATPRRSRRGVGPVFAPLAVRADGFAPAGRMVSFRGSPGLTERVAIVLARGVAVAGQVVDEAGAPVPGAVVVASAAAEPFPLVDVRRDGVRADEE
jgi:hypothetical protein